MCSHSPANGASPPLDFVLVIYLNRKLAASYRKYPSAFLFFGKTSSVNRPRSTFNDVIKHSASLICIICIQFNLNNKQVFSYMSPVIYILLYGHSSIPQHQTPFVFLFSVYYLDFLVS